MRAADFALRVRIEGGFAVDKEQILVMAMVQFDAQAPAPVGHAFHGIGARSPIVKVAN